MEFQPSLHQIKTQMLLHVVCRISHGKLLAWNNVAIVKDYVMGKKCETQKRFLNHSPEGNLS
jgi:hypothetical protein